MESNYSSDNIPEIALSWVSLGEPVVLATVVETWGSAPRRVGAQMAISLNGKMQGSVSGGCIENAVVSEAEETCLLYTSPSPRDKSSSRMPSSA